MITLLLTLTALPALADDAPEFLLGDVGVRVDLPRTWQMTRWSDWDFKASRKDDTVLMFAWATPGVVTPKQDELSLWTGPWEAKARELDAYELEQKAVELVDKGGVPAITFDYDFVFKDKKEGVMFGATVPVEGQYFHFVTVTRDAFRTRAEESRDELLERLEVKSKPAELDWGPTLEAMGITTPLPEDWRAPTEAETAQLTKTAEELGLDGLAGCAVGARPRGLTEPEGLVVCQGGLWLGVVDEYSFSGKDAELRELLFGGVAVPPAERLDLPDRTGLLFHPDIGSRALYMAVVPYDRGLARYWAWGEQDRDAEVKASLTTAVQNSAFSGPHPTGPSDWVSYFISYRPTHPVVLGTVLALLAFLGGLGFLLFGTGKKPDLDDL